MERKMEKFPVMCIASEATDEWTLCPHPMHVYGYNTAVQCIEHTRMLAFTCLHAASVIRDENNNNNIIETCKDLTENTGKITMTFTLLWFMLFFLFVCQLYIRRHFAPILFLCCVRDIFFPFETFIRCFRRPSNVTSFEENWWEKLVSDGGNASISDWCEIKSKRKYESLYLWFHCERLRFTFSTKNKCCHCCDFWSFSDLFDWITEVSLRCAA